MPANQTETRPQRRERSGLLTRPRLLAILQQRWERRVTVVVAGAGFGKSSLLAQAVAENRLSPRGIDRWVTCRHRDRPGSLLAEVAAALGISGAACVDDLLAAILADDVPTTLVVDDVHHLVVGSPDADDLTALVESAPTNVHFLLAGRAAPPVRLARLRALDDVVELSETDLRFDEVEVGALAAARGWDPAVVGGLGGWPAIIELAGRLGQAGALEFLIEEVVLRLPDDVRADLGVLVAVGGGGAGVLETAAGRPVDLDRLARDVPLLTRGADGSLTAHALWSELEGDLVGAGERRRLQRQAGAELLERGDLGRASDLALACGDPALLASVVREACQRSLAAADPGLLRSLDRALPDQLRNAAEGLLLRALIRRVEDPCSSSSRTAFEEAAAACRAAGLVHEELVALGGLAWVLRASDDDGLVAVACRIAELAATGAPEAVEGVRLLGAALAALGDDDRAVLAELETSTGALGPEWSALAAWLRADAQLMLGRPADALPHALECRALGIPNGYFASTLAVPIVRSALGDPAAALAELPDPASIGCGPFERFVVAAAVATVQALHGRADAAAEALAHADRAGPPARPEVRGWRALAESLLAVDRGDEEEAAGILRAFLAECPPTGPVARRVLRRVPAVAAVLVPESADALAGRGLAGRSLEQLEVGRVLLDLRAGRPLRAPFPDAAVVSGALPLRWCAELAVRAWCHRPDDAVDLADRLTGALGPPLWSAIRTMSASDRGAARFLAAVPAPPAVPVEVLLLGPLGIRADGRPVVADGLRRQRVRQLLALLVVRGRVRREEVIDTLWPDLDPAAASSNLRVNLAHLQKVLEPDRPPGTAPFLLRSTGDALVLAGAPYLLTDIDRFTDAVASGDRLTVSGAHRDALGEFEQASALWRSTALADIGDLPWCWDERERLRMQFVRVTERAAALRAALGDLDEAAHHAARVLAEEPWSEDAHRVLLTVALERGDRGAVRLAERACRAALADLGVEPSPALAMALRRATAP